MTIDFLALRCLLSLLFLRYRGYLSLVDGLITPTLLNSRLKMEYAVMIDAGSSGSRVRVYWWPLRTDRYTLPRFELIFQHKLNGLGISKFADNFPELDAHVNELLSKAKANIPKEEHHLSPLYLMATAGMRLLEERKAASIMDRIHSILLDKSTNPFRYHTYSARILSGEEEGAFAWIAVNYINNFFSPGNQKSSEGLLELGGSSAQIAFIPDSPILADKFTFKVVGQVFELYVHSYLYFGQESVDERVVAYLLEKNAGKQDIIYNPCMLKDDLKLIGEYLFEGLGSPEECSEILRTFVRKAPPRNCHPKPCSIGSVYQPSIGEKHAFQAVSAFTYPLKMFDMLKNETVFTPEKTALAATDYCRKNMVAIQEQTGKGNLLSMECLSGLYIPILLTEGYGFRPDSRQISANSNIEWSLGALIYEIEREDWVCPSEANIKNTGASLRNGLLTKILSGLLLPLAFLLFLQSL